MITRIYIKHTTFHIIQIVRWEVSIYSHFHIWHWDNGKKSFGGQSCCSWQLRLWFTRSRELSIVYGVVHFELRVPGMLDFVGKVCHPSTRAISAAAILLRILTRPQRLCSSYDDFGNCHEPEANPWPDPIFSFI